MAASANVKEPQFLIDVKEVSRRLGCSERHVWRLADAGKFPPKVRVGTLVKWRSSDLDLFIEYGGKWPVGRPTR